MQPYGKTENVFKRGDDNKLIIGEFRQPEFVQICHSVWRFTEKIDGTNIRIIFTEDGPEVRGRSDKAELHPQLVRNILALPGIDQILPGVTFYGEGYGPGIQKGGGNYRDDKGFILFDVRNHGGGQVWWSYEDVEFMAEELGCPVVPTVGLGPLYRGVQMVREGFKSTFGDFYAEGLIARPLGGLLNRFGERIQCKIKHKELFGR